MTLDELADELRLQAKSGSIVLSTNVLPQIDVDKISAAFMLGNAGRFEVTGISDRDITVTSSGEVRVSAGRTSVLGQKTVVPGLTFTVDEHGAVQYLVSAEMSADWTFASSFPSLSGYPFNQLGLSRTYFLYSSVDKAAYSPWSDAHSCPLAVGLNVLSQVSIKSADGALGLVKELLGSGTLYTASGTIAPDDRYRYPAMHLALEPDAKRIAIIDGFSIDNPAVRVSISEPKDSRQTIGLTLTASALDLLDISVEMSAAESALTFKATPLKGRVVDAAAIASLPFAKDFRNSIPPDLEEGFRNVTLGVFAITLIQGRTVGMVAITLKTPDDFRFEIVKDVLTLEGIALTLIFWGAETTVSVGAQCQLFPKRDLFPGIFGFTLAVDVGNGKAELAEIAGRYYGQNGDESGSIELPRLVSAIAGEQIQLPAALENLSFSDFGVSGRKVAGQGYSWTLYGHCKDAFPICGHPVSAALAAQATLAKGSYDIDLVGTLAIGEQHFVSELKLAKSQGGNGGTALLSAAWNVEGTDYLSFTSIAGTFGWKPDIPTELDLELSEASLTYDFTGEMLVLTAGTSRKRKAVFVAARAAQGSPTFLAVGIDVPLNVTFADIPVVGSKFPDAAQVGILDAGAWVLSVPVGQFPAVGKVNGLIPSGYPLLPVLDAKSPDPDVSSARLLLSTVLELGPGNQIPLHLALAKTTSTATPNAPTSGVAVADQGAPAAMPTSGGGAVTPPPQAASPDGAKWKDIQKTIGPLSLQRLGVKYADSQLYFLVDLGFSAGGLTIDLAGLSVSSRLTEFSPEFHLAGLELEYKSSVFEIAGEFLSMPPAPGVVFEYAGAATLKAGSFDLTALGAYAQLTSGQPSLFVFAVLEIPLGGPPYFFITGAAAGFGFNRRLVIPEVEDIPNFPLVAAAMNPSAVFPDKSNQTTSLSQALGVLEKYIPVEPGEYWLAAGIKFSSFEMISSFAMISVAFGNRLEIALLGESQLSIPPDPSGENPDNPKIANVEMALELRIDPDEGDFKVSAVLTRNSWLLDKSCRLTGGFAFYVWYGGEHAGDFVITLGGYNSHYHPAKWYPNEPRLGINWTIGTTLTIKGESYFALTPHAVMAGGCLEILFQVGGFKAWLNAYADFLIEWQPFYYQIDLGVVVGVSYTFDIFGAKFTLALEIGATLDISGPPFGGSATIHLWIISITIPIGDQHNVPPALTFDEFNRALLPKAADTPTQPIFITPTIVSGIIESPTSNQNLTMPIVAAGTFEIQVTSNWPASELLAVLPGAHDSATSNQESIWTFDRDLYARPMQGTTPFKGTLSVQVLYENKIHTDFFVLEPILKNAPNALWSKWDANGPSVNPTDSNGNPIVDSSGNPIVTIPQVPFGISLRAGAEQDEDPSARIPLENLAFERDGIGVSWPSYGRLGRDASGDALEAIPATIVEPAVVATRDAILKKLASAGTENLPESVVISPDIGQRPDDVFLAVPELASLGQLPTGTRAAKSERR